MRFYLGIDPGITGAFAYYDPHADELHVHDMPTHEIKTAGKRKRIIDMHELARLMDANASKVKRAIIEKVNAMPKQGITSAFNFGFSAGCIEMAVAANMVPYELVAPVVWKRAMGVSGDKVEARRKASQLMPKHAGNWPLVKHDGRAEAALLAFYLWNSFTNQQKFNPIKFADML